MFRHKSSSGENGEVKENPFFRKLIKPIAITLGVAIIGTAAFLGTKEVAKFVKKVNNIDGNYKKIITTLEELNKKADVTNNTLNTSVVPNILAVKDRIIRFDENGVRVRLTKEEKAQLEVTIHEEKRPSIFSRIWHFVTFRKQPKAEQVTKTFSNMNYSHTSNETANSTRGKSKKSLQPVKIQEDKGVESEK